MAVTCKKISEWIEEEVSKPVEEWEERQEKKCKRRKWYDPRKWLCWFVTILVKVVRWVVVTVGKWVVRTVCKVVATFVEMLREVLTGIWDVIAGIFTLDWRRILDGLLGILIGLAAGILWSRRLLVCLLARIAFLIDTLDFIFTEINRERLRRYVRKILEAKYSGETLDEIKEAIRLDHGAFGLRLDGTAYRTFLDSDTPSPTDSSAPNLVVLDEIGAINLRALCGFQFDEGFWNRKRYKTLKKGPTVAGGGGGEFDNPISEDELETYLSSRGAQGPPFIVLPARDGVFDRHVATAEDKGRELAIMLSFEKKTAEVIEARNISHNGSTGDQMDLLTAVLGRTSKQVDDPAATAELCNPVGAAIFRYMNTLRGLASPLRTTNCGLIGRNASGVTYIDNKPDQIWKYVLIHEFGHYFGLCHVDGLDRIMYSSRQNSWWRWQAIPNLLVLKGEPYFTLDDGKAAWDYIVDNFSPECLGARPQPPIPVVD